MLRRPVPLIVLLRTWAFVYFPGLQGVLCVWARWGVWSAYGRASSLPPSLPLHKAKCGDPLSLCRSSG